MRIMLDGVTQAGQEEAFPSDFCRKPVWQRSSKQLIVSFPFLPVTYLTRQSWEPLLQAEQGSTTNGIPALSPVLTIITFPTNLLHSLILFSEFSPFFNNLELNPPFLILADTDLHPGFPYSMVSFSIIFINWISIHKERYPQQALRRPGGFKACIQNNHSTFCHIQSKGTKLRISSNCRSIYIQYSYHRFSTRSAPWSELWLVYDIF